MDYIMLVLYSVIIIIVNGVTCLTFFKKGKRKTILYFSLIIIGIYLWSGFRIIVFSYILLVWANKCMFQKGFLFYVGI